MTESCFCGKDVTHEVQPPNPDRDDWVRVCEEHMNEIVHVSADVREIGGSDQ